MAWSAWPNTEAGRKAEREATNAFIEAEAKRLAEYMARVQGKPAPDKAEWAMRVA